MKSCGFWDDVLFNLRKVTSSGRREKNCRCSTENELCPCPPCTCLGGAERKRLAAVSYGANGGGLDSKECTSSVATPSLFFIKLLTTSLEAPFFFFSIISQWLWAGGATPLALYWADPRSTISGLSEEAHRLYSRMLNVPLRTLYQNGN